MPNRVPRRWCCDDVAQHRQQLAQRFVVAGREQVAIDRVEEPQRRVGGVIQPLALALGKHVRDEPVAHVVRERAQDVAGLAEPVACASVSPSRLIIVSRPQSVNQW